MTVKIIPYSTSAFLDKLSILLDLSKTEYFEVHKNILSKNGEWFKESKALNQYYKGFYASVGNAKTATLNIQIKSSGNKGGLLRIEFNPAHKGIDYFQLKSTLAVIVKGGSKRFFEEGRVKKIDVATDIKYLPIANLIIDYPKMQKGKSYQDQDSGFIETLNQGTPKSNILLKAYDKVKELQDAGIEVPDTPSVTRIEITMKKLNLNFDGIPDLPNPFQNIKLTAIINGIGDKADIIEALIIMLSQTAGYPLAIKRIKAWNEYQGKVYEKKILAAGSSHWWKPEQIWDGMGPFVAQLKSQMTC